MYLEQVAECFSNNAFVLRALKRQAPRPPAEEPRRSLSAESLTCTSMASSSASATTVSNVADISGKKKKSHGHFSLRKLLRFGSKESTQNGCSDNKTNSAVSGGTNSTNLSNGAMLLPKPRPEIIHPLDLMNASPVQVVGSATSTNKVKNYILIVSKIFFNDDS